MAINNNYEYSDENQLLYNIDNYVINSGSSIEFSGGKATLKNINTNPKSDNFFGNGELGSQTFAGNQVLNPTSMYFRNLIVNDPVYGTHLEGIFTPTGEFSPGDEVILYKKHCCDKMYYDEIGKWDIVTISEKIIDSSGNPRYVIEKQPDNDYTDITANTATAVLQFENMTIAGSTYLGGAGGSGKQSGNTSYTWHPESGEPWNNRAITRPEGILYIKVRNKFKMLEGSTIWNWRGAFGGYQYHELGTDRNVLGVNLSNSGSWVAPCGFLCSPSIQTNVERILETADFCDFAGYPGGVSTGLQYSATGGASFWNEGSKASTLPFVSQKIPMSYRGATDLDKIFMGMPGGIIRDYYHNYGSDGGGIIIVQAKETEIQNNCLITSSPILRHNPSYDRPAGTPAGGTTILKTPKISTVSTKPFIGTVSYSINETYDGRNYSSYGITNAGTSILECEAITIDGTEYAFDELYTESDILKNKIFHDLYLNDTIADDVDLTASTSRLTDYVKPEPMRESLIQAPTTSMSEYEINKFYKVYTAGFHNIDTSLWQIINGFEIGCEVPEDTDLRFLFSRDEGSTWFKLNPGSDNFSNVNLSDIGNGNTQDELENYANSLVLTSNLVFNSDAKRLDIAVGLKTTVSYKTPSLDYFKIVYSGIDVPEAPVRILPYHEEEFDAEYVNFVFMQPLGTAGSVQNRIEISTTPNFDAQEIVLDLTDAATVSSTNNEVHIPYQSVQYNNYVNNMSNLVLPFMLNRAIAPQDTYEERQTSTYFDLDTTIDIKGDVWFYKGSTVKLPDSTIELPNINTLAPLLHNTSYASADFKLLLNGATSISGWNTKNIQSIDTYYQGQSSQFSGNSGVSKYGFTKYDLPAIVTPGEKTIHFKFKVNSNVDVPLFNFGRENSTDMAQITVNTNYVRVANITYQIVDKNLYAKQQYYDGIEMNITIVVKADETFKLYVNGHFALDSGTTTWIKYLNYFTAESYDDFTYGINFGCAFLYNDIVSSGFNGIIHEVLCWNRIFNESEIKEISKTPNFMLRYDFRDTSYKWVQFPCEDTDIMEENELWDKPYKYDISFSDMNPILLGNVKNRAYDSNNESLLIGKLYPVETKAMSYVPHEPIKHIINGYPYFINANMLNDYDRIQLNANNSISTPYLTAANMMFGRVGRIHKDITSTSIEFAYNSVPTGNAANIGVVYSIFSSSNTFPYWMYINIGTDGVAKAVLYLYASGWVTYQKPISLTTGNRYKLSVEPINSSFRSDFRVKLYSATDDAYKTNPEITKYSDFTTTPMTYSWGFNSSSYSDLDYNNTSGNWVEANALIDTRGSNAVSLIGLSNYDSTSSITRDSGYTPYYFIEKTLPLATTTNIVRFNIKSEIPSAMTKVKHIISFDTGATWKAYSSVSNSWSVLSTDATDVENNGMEDADLFSVTNAIAEAGGFGSGDVILRTYLITNEASISPKVTSHIIERNGPRIIDSWIEQGSYYDPSYEWFYVNDNSWNPYLEIDTSGGVQGWEAMGTNIPNPTVFNVGAGAKPSTNLAKTYTTVKIDCLPKGKWYWRVAAYNGIKR